MTFLKKQINSLPNRRLQLFTYVLLQIAAVDLLFGIMLSYAGYTAGSFWLLFNSAAYLLVFLPLMLYTKFYLTVRVGLTFFTTTMISLCGCYYGPHLNVTYTVMVGTMYPFLAFSGKEKKARLLALVPPIAQFFFFEAGGYQLFPALGLETAFLEAGNWVGKANVFCAILIVTGSYYIFNAQTEKLERGLKKAYLEVEISDKNSRRKAQEYSNLVQIVVHDIANLMTIPIWHIEKILQKHPNNLNATTAKTSLHRVKEIINNVRRLHAISLGKERPPIEKIGIKDAIEDAVESVRPMLDAKDMRAKFLISTKFKDKRVFANDSLLTESVLVNLISNAVKFSRAGSTIEIKCFGKNNRIKVSVKDCGIGIPTKLLKNLFAEDKVTSRPGTNGERGTGFGLPIVKNSLELMGGNIEVVSSCSEEGAKESGTVFTIDLQVAA